MTQSTPSYDPIEPSARLPHDQDAEVTLSAERLRAVVRRVPVETVRVRTRVVTETRTITVQVRREELVLERAPLQTVLESSADGLDALDGLDGLDGRGNLDGREGRDGSDSSGAEGGPVIRMVLREEVPEVVTRLVPVEEIRVYREWVTGSEQVNATLAREQLDVTTVKPSGGIVDRSS